MMDDNNIARRAGAVIKATREAKGITAHELADAVGHNYNTILRMQKGKHVSIWPIMARVCVHLGLEFKDIMPSEESNE